MVAPGKGTPLFNPHYPAIQHVVAKHEGAYESISITLAAS